MKNQGRKPDSERSAGTGSPRFTFRSENPVPDLQADPLPEFHCFTPFLDFELEPPPSPQATTSSRPSPPFTFEAGPDYLSSAPSSDHTATDVPTQSPSRNTGPILLPWFEPSARQDTQEQEPKKTRRRTRPSLTINTGPDLRSFDEIEDAEDRAAEAAERAVWKAKRQAIRDYNAAHRQTETYLQQNSSSVPDADPEPRLRWQALTEAAAEKARRDAKQNARAVKREALRYDAQAKLQAQKEAAANKARRDAEQMAQEVKGDAIDQEKHPRHEAPTDAERDVIDQEQLEHPRYDIKQVAQDIARDLGRLAFSFRLAKAVAEREGQTNYWETDPQLRPGPFHPTPSPATLAAPQMSFTTPLAYRPASRPMPDGWQGARTPIPAELSHIFQYERPTPESRDTTTAKPPPTPRLTPSRAFKGQNRKGILRGPREGTKFILSKPPKSVRFWETVDVWDGIRDESEPKDSPESLESLESLDSVDTLDLADSPESLGFLDLEDSPEFEDCPEHPPEAEVSQKPYQTRGF